MTEEDVHYRMLSIAVRKFAGRPEDRRASTFNMLRAAIALHALYASPGDAALAAAEALEPFARAERGRRRRAG